MPHYYFDVTRGLRFMPDEEGCVLDSLDAAEYEATQTLIQLGRHWLARSHEVSIQVRDERHRLVIALSLALKIERQEPFLDPA